jgi:hypothetical protein
VRSRRSLEGEELPIPSGNPENEAFPLQEPLAKAAEKAGGAKPEAREDRRGAKKNYAQVLSNEAATMLANCLRCRYPHARVTPLADGTKQELTLGKGLDRKKTDVGVWDDAAGLALGISIKTYSFRDPSGKTVNGYFPKVGRYVKNVKRNDMELRDEADVLHRRQRYAVLVAIMFLPEDACWDAGNESRWQSSFAHHVFTFRKRAGRDSPDAARTDLFEKVYIGLFKDTGAVRFFDVEQAPPRNQPPAPSATLSLQQLMDRLVDEVQYRNTGLRADDDKYAPDDPSWQMPSDWRPPEGLDTEPPVTYEDSLDEGDETLEDDADQ